MRAREDDGQVLGMALAFLVFVALVLSATLIGATSQLHATQTLEQQRDDQYSAEASVYAAVQSMRSDVAKGADWGQSSTPCDFAPPLGYVVNGVQASVTCSPRTGSGVGDGGEDHAAVNRPSYGVLALPTDPSSVDEGVINDGGGQVNVFGPVHSNGGQCQLTTPPCDTSPVQDPGTDPRVAAGYALVPATAPPAQNPPACVNGLATFSPGTYHSVPDGACPSLVFTPGPYYFDFTSPGSHTWTVPVGQTVVGGTPGTQPGSCLTEHDLGSNGGVLFAFGGDSGMRVGSGATVHLCAAPSSTAQEIAVYGVKTDAPGLTQSYDQSPRTSRSQSNPAYVPANVTATIDGTDGSAQLSAAQTASLDFTRFRSLPAQAIVQSATIELVHGEDPAMQSLKLDVRDGSRVITSFTSDPIPSDPACGLNQLCIGATDHHDSFDVTSVFRDPTTSFFNQSTLTNLNLEFTASAPPGLGGPYASDVDGVVLHVTLSPGAGGYRALTGCAQDLSAAGCPVLSTDPGATLVLDGTAYVPTGVVEVKDTASRVTFNRGLIARTVVFHSGGSAPFVTAGGGFDRYVILSATVNGTQRLSTSVTFGDVAAYLSGDPTEPSITYNTWDVT